MTFLNISLRQSAIYVPNNFLENDSAPAQPLSEDTILLVSNLSKLGYTVSEGLLRALDQTDPAFKTSLFETFRQVMNVDKNWTPLVKGWGSPTHETRNDHLAVWFANIFGLDVAGTTLACGHLIPNGTFPLERYNGCPFCGTPFEFDKLVFFGQNKKLKLLQLWTEKDLTQFLKNLLSSKTALDATQVDSLKYLLQQLPLPADLKVEMKETLILVIDALIECGKSADAQQFFKSPTDILRYLWYKHTGFLQIVAPKTILRRELANNKSLRYLLKDKLTEAVANASLNKRERRREKRKDKQKPASAYKYKQNTQEADVYKNLRASKYATLKLKYGRKMCAIVAAWLNALPLSATQICEQMHPKREMWVRFIRALRLPEYSHRTGFEPLAKILDTFYNQKYEVWQGKVNKSAHLNNLPETLELLKQRPGAFARNLFAYMLHFSDSQKVVAAFKSIVDKVPARLIFTLNAFAQIYFNPNEKRSVKPLGGVSKKIAAHPKVALLKKEKIAEMQSQIEDLCIGAMEWRFSNQKTESKTIYIEPQLFKMPVAIGDRSESVQDMPVALMGTRFAVEGDKVRLFMQWGAGLPAQHMDMDLSARIAYPKHLEMCAFYELSPLGCRHSGDIRQIPNKIGTAEYIELDIPTLQKAGALYVSFACNAYSNGAINPNTVVGWMNCEHPMKISDSSGVAYDPSCVQHQVRIQQKLAKGLVFGVLEVQTKEIIWLEMPFGGQLAANLDVENVRALLSKLDSKLNVGALLSLKAKAQNLTLVTDPKQADEAYTMQWAMDAAAVTKLLVD